MNVRPDEASDRRVTCEQCPRRLGRAEQEGIWRARDAVGSW